MVKNLAEAKHDKEHSASMEKSFKLIPEFAEKTGYWYGELIKMPVSNDLLFAKAASLTNDIRVDETTINTMWSFLTKALEKEKADSSLRTALQGDYYIHYAWTARGSGWSNTVTQNGWRLFKERLEKASDILQTAYPESQMKGALARRMITVELGLEKGRNEMEPWFQRAIESDPDDYAAYLRKMNYLLPRWYGSSEDLWKYGLECVKTQNWSAKIPMILVEALEDLSENNSKIYSKPQIWEPLEQVFRTYLQKYPESTVYRTKFAKCAAEGGHWKIAKEQFDILGDEWNWDSIDAKDYKSMRDTANREGR